MSYLGRAGQSTAAQVSTLQYATLNLYLHSSYFCVGFSFCFVLVLQVLLRILQNLSLWHISSQFRTTNLKIYGLSQEEVMDHSLPCFPNLVQKISADLIHHLHFVHRTGYHLCSSFSRTYTQSYSLTLSISWRLVLPPVTPHIPPSYTSITPTHPPVTQAILLDQCREPKKDQIKPNAVTHACFPHYLPKKIPLICQTGFTLYETMLTSLFLQMFCDLILY